VPSSARINPHPNSTLNQTTIPSAFSVMNIFPQKDDS
jgi:hypothetical protein